MKKLIVASALAATAIARAQPAPDGGGDDQPPLPPEPKPAPQPPPLLDKQDPDKPTDPYPETHHPYRRPPDPAIGMPEVLSIPTGWLLPAAVLYSKSSIDTGGGVSSDTRVGLGDVAEFGIATTDQVRAKVEDSDHPERIQPYLVASFRMGVSEDRLFTGQPGLTLGFRKSFERNHDDEKTRIAELTLVASRHIGPRTAIHVGGAFWDASLQPAGGEEVTLHGGNDQRRQVRPFGGIQVQPIDKSEILIDLSWGPEFCYHCTGNDQIRLRPQLSWGVRYHVADWMLLESGVRVPDIGQANLLDAQIFGSLVFTSWALHHAVDSLK
jgi:hypothetical protein